MKRAVFLDRDGVINELVERLECGYFVVESSPRKFEEFKFIDGIKNLLADFTAQGFLNIVITNQPDIARHLMEEKELQKMHNFIRGQLFVDDIFVCPHDDMNGCSCRKPKPGLLLEAAKKWDIDLSNSFMIGDDCKDIEAGEKVGCTTILIDKSCNLSKVGEIIIMGNYIDRYLDEVTEVAEEVYQSSKIRIEQMIRLLVDLRDKKGRLFFLGVGGGAGNSSHAVSDFRKIAAIEAYAPTDNISELSARINDNGWESVFVEWLKGSNLNANDGVFVFSVGGGNEKKNVSTNIVEALKYTKQVGATIFGIIGRDGGYTKKVADSCIVIPTISSDTVTAHTESFQAVLWHLIVSHPDMKISEMKWESI